MIAKVIPTPWTVPTNAGGSTKFGAAPLGLMLSGNLDRSVPGGRAARDIVKSKTSLTKSTGLDSNSESKVEELFECEIAMIRGFERFGF